MGLTSGPHLFSPYYYARLYLLRFSVVPSKGDSNIPDIVRTLHHPIIFFFFFLFFFFFYSVALVRLLQNSLSTEVGGVAAAAEILPIRDGVEKNVGCMPVGLCHFRRGLS